MLLFQLIHVSFGRPTCLTVFSNGQRKIAVPRSFDSIKSLDWGTKDFSAQVQRATTGIECFSDQYVIEIQNRWMDA